MTPNPDDPVSRAQQFAEILQAPQTKAAEAIKKANVIAKRNADRHRRPVTYLPDDLVLLDTQNLRLPLTLKLRPRYCGPFRISHMITPVTAHLLLPADCPALLSTAADAASPCRGRGPTLPPTRPRLACALPSRRQSRRLWDPRAVMHQLRRPWCSRPWTLEQPSLDPEQPPLAPEAAAPGAAAPGLRAAAPGSRDAAPGPAAPPLDPVQPPPECRPCSPSERLLFPPLATATGTGGGQMQLQRRPRESLTPQQLREWYASWGCGGSRRSCRPGAGDRTGQTCGTLSHTHSRCFARLSDDWRTEFGHEAELPDWVELLGQRVDIFALDYDAILTAMYALPTSADRTCYLCVPPGPGIEPAALGAGEATALGASASLSLGAGEAAAPGAGEAAAPGAGESTLFGTAPGKALYTFTLDSGASRSFFRDSTTLTPLSRPVPVSLADPSGGPVLAHSSTVLPCPAVPFGSLSGLHLPSFSTNLVSGADQFTPGGQRVTHCTCSWTGRHLATFTCAPGSSLYTPTTVSPQVAASASASGQLAAPCLCRALSHQTLLWHHRLGHPSVQRLRSMHHRVLVSGLPRVLPPLLPSPAPPCLPCVEGRQRATPHSSSFPPIEAPLQTLHMDVGGEFSSDLLAAFCAEHGIRQTFTLPASPQQNGVAERRIGLVMEYAAHQLNLWPRVSLPETSPTLLWTGKVGDASRFRVWGARAFVCDTTADKLSARTVPCVFLGFVPDAPGWQFYHPTLRRVFPSQDVTFDESVPFYRLFPYRTAPLPPPLLFLAPGAPQVDPLPAPGPAPSDVSQVDPPPLTAPPGDAEPGREESRGAEHGGIEPGGAAPGGAEVSGEQSPWSGRLRSRPAGTLPLHSRRRLPLSPQQLREWYVGHQGRTAGARGPAAGGAGAGDSATGVVSAGGSGAAEGARARRCRATEGAGAGGSGAAVGAGTEGS
ncbi:unnamed protein product, partial [Closterium sp. NIES-53]